MNRPRPVPEANGTKGGLLASPNVGAANTPHPKAFRAEKHRIRRKKVCPQGSAKAPDALAWKPGFVAELLLFADQPTLAAS